MNVLKLILFGPPRLEQNGQPVEISRRKSMAMLAYLAASGQPHSRDALASLLRKGVKAMNLAGYTIKQRINILRWFFPVTLATITILYQLWSAHLAHNYYGDTIHLAVEFLFYATVGPLLIFVALTRLGHWLEEKEQRNRSTSSNSTPRTGPETFRS